jgi:hypothetical protein
VITPAGNGAARRAAANAWEMKLPDMARNCAASGKGLAIGQKAEFAFGV